MLGALTQRQGEFRYGRYLGVQPSNNVATAPIFTYERMGTNDRRYNHLVQNLITVEDSVVIRTSYKYEWLNQAFVVLQDGQRYIINNIKEYDEEVNPQVFDIMKCGSDVITYMELVNAQEFDDGIEN